MGVVSSCSLRNHSTRLHHQEKESSSKEKKSALVPCVLHKIMGRKIFMQDKQQAHKQPTQAPPTTRNTKDQPIMKPSRRNSEAPHSQVLLLRPLSRRTCQQRSSSCRSSPRAFPLCDRLTRVASVRWHDPRSQAFYLLGLVSPFLYLLVARVFASTRLFGPPLQRENGLGREFFPFFTRALCRLPFGLGSKSRLTLQQEHTRKNTLTFFLLFASAEYLVLFKNWKWQLGKLRAPVA